MTTIDKLILWAKERGLHLVGVNKSGFVANIVEELGEYLEAKSEHDMVDAIANIAVFCITELRKMKYNPELVLNEVHKEIASRTGSWNAEKTKWVKDTSEEAKKRWVKADFEKARILW